MNASWHNVEDALAARRCDAPGLVASFLVNYMLNKEPVP